MKGETYLLPYLCISLLICFFVFHSPSYIIIFVFNFYLFIFLLTNIAYYFYLFIHSPTFQLSLYLFPYLRVFIYVFTHQFSQICNEGRVVLHQLFLWGLVGFTVSQVTKALRESRGIAVLYFRPQH